MESGDKIHFHKIKAKNLQFQPHDQILPSFNLGMFLKCSYFFFQDMKRTHKNSYKHVSLKINEYVMCIVQYYAVCFITRTLYAVHLLLVLR